MSRFRCALALLVTLTLSYAAHADSVRLPDGAELRAVQFERHVAALLGKAGCSAGSCHGSFQGKGGLRLSLFGYSPELDHRALTRDGMGRRVNFADPDRSLLLLKATAQVSHGGGKRFDKASWQYGVLRAWIADGCQHERAAAVARLDVSPREHLFAQPGDTVALTVNATFADGTCADLTPFCEFRAKDDSIADVSPLGIVRGSRPGDTAIVVTYRGHIVTARVLVAAPHAMGAVYADVPRVNFIDREVFAKLRRLNVVPSELSSDAEFLRRVTIDAIGSLPTPEEVRSFGADARPDKRALKIEELLVHPLHAAVWATKFCDITGNNIDVLDGSPETRPLRAAMFFAWFRKRIADNVPYDRIVRGVLTATSRDGEGVDAWVDREIAAHRAAEKGDTTAYAARTSLDLFWRRVGGDDFFPLEQMAEQTAAAFLGARLECAQCHKHPYDRWTQTDYRAFANVFAQLQVGISPEATAAMADRLEARRRLPPDKAGPPLPRLREIFVDTSASRRLADPETDSKLGAKFLGGPAVDLGNGDARAVRRLADEAGQPLLCTRVRQPRLGALPGRRPRRTGGRFLCRQPAIQRAAARRPGLRLRSARLRHSPSGATRPQFADVPANIGDERHQRPRSDESLARGNSPTAGRGRGGRAQRRAGHDGRLQPGCAARQPGRRGSDQSGAQPASGAHFPRFRPAGAGGSLRLRAAARAGAAADAVPDDRLGPREKARRWPSRRAVDVETNRRGNRRRIVPRHAVALAGRGRKASCARPRSRGQRSQGGVCRYALGAGEYARVYLESLTRCPEGDG